MVGSTAGLGVHALAQKFQVLQLVAVEASGDADALATDDDHLLACKKEENLFPKDGLDTCICMHGDSWTSQCSEST